MTILIHVVLAFLFLSSLFWITTAEVLILRYSLMFIKNRKTKGELALILKSAYQIKTFLLCMLCGALLLFLCVIVENYARSHILLLVTMIFIWVIISAGLSVIAMIADIVGNTLKNRYCGGGTSGG